MFWLAYLSATVILVPAWLISDGQSLSVPRSPVLLDRGDQLLAARIAADEQWRFAPTEPLSPRYATALLTYEDARFNFHFGLDPFRLVRAAINNMTGKTKKSGASTLTMQLARQTLGHPTRSWRNKIHEAFFAIGLEMRYGKAEILRLYADRAPFGANVVGIEAASWRYYGRAMSDLSWAEAATLAVMPNSPSTARPGHGDHRLLDKRNRLLAKLRSAGHINETDYGVALVEPVPDRLLPIPTLASHLLTTGDRRLGRNEAIRSTIDRQIQVRGAAVMERHSRRLRSHLIDNVAALVIDNESFDVLGYFGNGPGSVESTGSGARVDIIHRRRSTGSTLKPLLFAQMLDEGMLLPDMLIPDLPSRYHGYIPENYDRKYRGAVRAKEALAASLNVPAVKMLEQAGVGFFLNFLRAMGFTTFDRSATNYGLTLILGGGESTVWELGQAYANLLDIARMTSKGTLRRLRVFQSDSTETELATPISPGAAWLTLESLIDVKRTEDRAHWKNFSSSQKIAWKTGTSYGHRDGWAVGNSGRYTITVWVGNATGEGREDLTGTEMAGPILFDLFDIVPKSPWISRPEANLKSLNVCEENGRLPANGCRTVAVQAPIASRFTQLTSDHQQILVDSSGTYRVHAGCMQEVESRGQTWFSLPADQEYYYQMQNPNYRRLPPWHPDCPNGENSDTLHRPMELLYPRDKTKIYIPVDIGGQFGSSIFHAFHRDPDEVIYWHLDNHYIGKTRTFHEMSVQVGFGSHDLTIVDQRGFSVHRQFEAINQDPTIAAEPIKRKI